MEKLKISQAILVEGKYDKIRLESMVDALILTLEGFRIYKDTEMRALIRTLAKSRGIIVLTDSDGAGFKLRGHINGIISEGKVIHVYIPDIFGKEKRKRAYSAERKLGVEGMDTETLRTAFARAGVLELGGQTHKDPVTRIDLYNDGLCGGENSAVLRRKFYRELGLPARLSTTAALELINHMLTKTEYKALLEKLNTDFK